MAPRELRLAPGAGWPLHDVVEAGGPVLVDDLATRFRGHVVGAARLAPGCAVVHPLRHDADDRAAGMLILGTHPFLVLDERYREFLTLTGDTVAARVAEAHARLRERQRVERLAELDRAKTEFFSNVSHEFRTPLTLMLGPLDEALQRGDELPADLVRELDVARHNARRLLRLTGALLDFSQIEAGRLRAQCAPVDLAERTREFVTQFEGAVTRAGLRLRMGIEPIGEPVWVDVSMWEKIVANLLSNALKFTFEGEIEVSLRGLARHAELVVRDSGVGIPDEELPYIFKRFHRVRGARARTHEGAGIGLALVDALVRRHHGRIRATSTVDAGTTFTVWIPLGPQSTRDQAQAPETGVAEAMAEEASRWDVEPFETAVDAVDEAALRSRAPGARVLVVDDNPDMRGYLARLLGGNWTVAVAHDGEQALRLARDDPPDLVVADVMMPRLDGFGLLRALRDDARLTSTPVVLVTARAGEETAIEGLLAGADDYIVKPFSARELVARVGGQLELARTRRRAAELNAFRIGLSDALRQLSEPLEIQRTACRMLLEQLGADRARFVEMDEATGQFVTMGGHAREPMPGGYGRYAIDAFAPLARTIRAGRRLAIEDTQNDPYVRDIRDALAELQIGAQLVLPLVRDGGSAVALAVHQRTARRWTTEEVAIAEEAAGRAWAEVERARAEVALRESEERYRKLAQAASPGAAVS
jgi:signal transduction histidine kinase/DNA-binding response OmpR family regulator